MRWLLLTLAACSSGTRTPVTSPAELETAAAAPAPVKPAVESKQTYEHDTDAAEIGPVRTYALPDATLSALARERLRGQVLVAGPLFPSETAARGAVTTIDDAPQPIAMRVVADRGKVVQVTTSAGADCVESFAQHYELSVYVPRASLVPRTTTPIMKAFEDGTAYAIDRGAPVRVTSAGAAWFDTMVDQTGAAPPERLAYSLVKPYTPATVPPASGERMVCDGAPMTKSEWAAKKQQQLDRVAAKNTAAARRAADLRAQTRASAKTDAVDGLVDLALNDRSTKGGADGDAPYCSVVPATAKPQAAKLGGAGYAWTGGHVTDHVYRADQGYLAEVGATCARVRVVVDPAAVQHAAAPDGGALRGARQRVWIPRPGPVFWPDGTKAGKYTGRDEKLLRVTEHGDLICVDVRGVAEEVCHRRADVTIEN